MYIRVHLIYICITIFPFLSAAACFFPFFLCIAVCRLDTFKPPTPTLKVACARGDSSLITQGFVLNSGLKGGSIRHPWNFKGTTIESCDMKHLDTWETSQLYLQRRQPCHSTHLGLNLQISAWHSLSVSAKMKVTSRKGTLWPTLDKNQSDR